MSRLKAAFHVFVNSAIKPSYYKDLLHVNFGFSIKYLLVLACFASLVSAVTVAPQISGYISNAASDLRFTATNQIPDDLLVTIKSGELSINQPQPYIIPLESEDEVSGVENFLVVDTEGTVSDLETYKTLVLVNKTNILMRENNGIKVYPLKDTPDTEITKAGLLELMNKVDGFLGNLLYLLVPVLFLLALIYYFVIKLMYLLIVSVVVAGISAARGLSLKFSKVYQISLHAMTLPLVIEVVSSTAGMPITIPFWFLLLNLTVAIIGITQINKN